MEPKRPISPDRTARSGTWPDWSQRALNADAEATSSASRESGAVSFPKRLKRRYPCAASNGPRVACTAAAAYPPARDASPPKGAIPVRWAVRKLP